MPDCNNEIDYNKLLNNFMLLLLSLLATYLGIK